MAKSCTNCPGATDHDTAHCPLMRYPKCGGSGEVFDSSGPGQHWEKCEKCGGSGKCSALAQPYPANTVAVDRGAQGELKPCPFCGGQARLTHDDYVHEDLRPMPVVECTNCHTWVRAESWNNRVSLAQPSPKCNACGGSGKVEFERGSVIKDCPRCHEFVRAANAERVAGGLRSEADAWAARCAKAEDERDAAQARVAKLETHLSDAVEMLAEAEALLPKEGGSSRHAAWRKFFPRFITRIGYEAKSPRGMELMASVAQAGQVPDIDAMVNRFLSWRLPENFSPDCGISFTPVNHPNAWPVGTNLFTAEQTKAMIQHMFATPAQGGPTDE